MLGTPQQQLSSCEDVAFEVQKPVLEKWGFEACTTTPSSRAQSICSQGNEHGVREMTAAIREHAGRSGKDCPSSLHARQNSELVQDMPQWLKEKQDRQTKHRDSEKRVER